MPAPGLVVAVDIGTNGEVLLGSRERMSNHASDALAVALCHVLASPLLKVTA